MGVVFIVNSFLLDWLVGKGNMVAGLSAMIGAIILGWPILLTAIKDIRRGILSINELVAIAVLAAFASGESQTGGYQTAALSSQRVLTGHSGAVTAVAFCQGGASLVTGWARIHGRPIGILANAQGVLFSEEAQ